MDREKNCFNCLKSLERCKTCGPGMKNWLSNSCVEEEKKEEKSYKDCQNTSMSKACKERCPCDNWQPKEEKKEENKESWEKKLNYILELNIKCCGKNVMGMEAVLQGLISSEIERARKEAVERFINNFKDYKSIILKILG